MLDRRKGPSRAFTHADDCKIVKVTPGVEIPWSEIRAGVWEAVCQCGVQYHYETPADRRTRHGPLDPSTSRHAPQCEHAATTDPVPLRAILRVKDGWSGDYWWVECSICEHGWQVFHYAADSVG